MFRFSIEDEKLLVSYMPERGVDWIFDVLKKVTFVIAKALPDSHRPANNSRS